MQSTINYEMLNSCSNQLKKVANDMQYITDQVSNIVKSIEINEFWVGKGADYFQTQYKNIIPYFNEAYDQVVNYAIFIENTLIKYEQTDIDISKIVR